MIHTAYFDFPGNKLSPNARIHYMALHKAKKAYKQSCSWALLASGLRKIDAEGLHVRLTFSPPSRARFDLDGLISRCKAALDAIAEVTGIDDHKFTLSASIAPSIAKNGQVRVDIEWDESERIAA